LLFVLEPLLPQHQLVEVHRVAVEVRTVDAGEPHPSIDGYPARSAHPSPVHHDRVQAHRRVDAIGLGQLGAGLHHRQWTDGNHFLDIRMLSQHLIQDHGHQPLGSERAVVRRHAKLVGVAPEAVAPEHQVLAAEADDRNRVGPELLMAPKLRKNRSDPQAAADQDDLLALLDPRRHSQGPDEVEDRLAPFQVHHPMGGLTHRLDHDRDTALQAVEVRDGQRNALSRFVDAHHDEMTGMAGSGDLGRQDLPLKGQRTEWRSLEDFIHERPRLPPQSERASS
jgi:hypothetical protein